MIGSMLGQRYKACQTYKQVNEEHQIKSSEARSLYTCVLYMTQITVRDSGAVNRAVAEGHPGAN